MGSFFLSMLLDIIITYDGEVECRIKSVSMDSIEYMIGNQTGLVSTDKVDYIIVKGFPEEFSRGLSNLAEGKYTLARSMFQDTLLLVKQKKIKDPLELLGTQSAYFILLCKIKEKKEFYVKNPLEKHDITTFIEGGEFKEKDAKQSAKREGILSQYKNKFILLRMLRTVFEFYVDINDLPRYIKTLKEYETQYSPSVYDSLYFNITDFFAMKGDYKKALEVFDSRQFVNILSVNQRKANIYLELVDSEPTLKSKFEAVVNELMRDIKSDQDKFTAELFASKLDYINGNKKQCLRRLVNMISFLNHEVYKENYSVIAMRLLARCYEDIGESSPNKNSKTWYYSMARSTLIELLTYYPNTAARNDINKEIARLDEKMN